MKRCVYFFIICWCCMLQLNAQVNLVPNPSFELYDTCPSNWYQINYATDWLACKGSPDYFNTCGTTDSFDVPQNLIGNQIAAGGSAYCGLILYDKSNNGNDEIIGTILNQNLTIGVRYYVSFQIVWKYNNPYSICCSQDKIGAKFSSIIYSQLTPPPQNNSAHVFSSTIISDTNNWTRILGSFVADSAYSFVMIGNFFDNSNLNVNDQIPANNSSYYFLDNVCVSTDSLYAANYSTGIIVADGFEQIQIGPNPATDYFELMGFDPILGFDICIYNALGQAILYERNRSNTRIELEGIEKGLLWIEITVDEKKYYHKLIHL